MSTAPAARMRCSWHDCRRPNCHVPRRRANCRGAIPMGDAAGRADLCQRVKRFPAPDPYGRLCPSPPARQESPARTRWPVRGRPVALWVGGLPYFDQMTVGIAHITALLVLVLFRRRQELSTPGGPFGVHGLDIPNPDIEETADP